MRVVWDKVSNDEKHFEIWTHPHGESPEIWTRKAITDADVTSAEITLDDAVSIFDIRVDATKGSLALTSADSNVVQQSGIRLRSVGFDSQTIVRDNGNGAYTGPQWYDSDLNGVNNTSTWLDMTFDNATGDHVYPVSYQRSSGLTDRYISATPVASYTGDTAANWRLRGVHLGQEGIDFNCTWSAYDGAVTIAAAAATPLPSTIESQQLTEKWQLSTDGGSNWFDVGTSENQMFVTGTSTIGAYETMLYLRCTGAAGFRPSETADGVVIGQLNDNNVVTGVWNKFSSLNVHRVDGQIMNYCHAEDVFEQRLYALSAQGMLARSDGNGQCTAWAELFADTLFQQGISAVVQNVYPPSSNGAFAVQAIPAQGSGGSNYIPGTFLAGGFSFHQIVRIGAFSSRIYDPSYGSITVPTSTKSAELIYEDTYITDIYTNGNWEADVAGDSQQLLFI